LKHLTKKRKREGENFIEYPNFKQINIMAKKSFKKTVKPLSFKKTVEPMPKMSMKKTVTPMPKKKR